MRHSKMSLQEEVSDELTMDFIYAYIMSGRTLEQIVNDYKKGELTDVEFRIALKIGIRLMLI